MLLKKFGQSTADCGLCEFVVYFFMRLDIFLLIFLLVPLADDILVVSQIFFGLINFFLQLGEGGLQVSKRYFIFFMLLIDDLPADMFRKIDSHGVSGSEVGAQTLSIRIDCLAFRGKTVSGESRTED